MKKTYKFGDILIIANFNDVYSVPTWGYDEHPEYIVTIRTVDNKKRHSVKAWGMLAGLPDCQHQSLAGIVLSEHLQDVGEFQDFCDEFGYSSDSIKALEIYKKLKACYQDGFWYNLVKDCQAFKLWQKSGQDLEDFLMLAK